MLTARGRDFRPVLLALLAWGNRHFAPEGASVVLVRCPHRSRGRSGAGRPQHRPADRGAGLLYAAGPAPARARDAVAHDPAMAPSVIRARRRAFRCAPCSSTAETVRRASALGAPARAPRAAARTDRADPAAPGLAEHAGHAGAGLDRPDRDLVRRRASAPTRWPAWRWCFPA